MIKRVLHISELVYMCIVIILIAIIISNLNKKLNTQREWIITQHGFYDGPQSMFYTIESAEGQLIIIDGGWKEHEEYVKEIIKEHGNKVDIWILTHPHADHIGAFIEIYQNNEDIIIDDIYTVDMATPELCEENAPWDDTSIYKEFLSLDRQQIKYLHKGDTLTFDGLTLNVLSAYDDYVDTESNNLINDGSLMFMLNGKHESMLYCADVVSLSDYLIKEYGEELKADYLQMAHHGNAGLSKEFYALVNPKISFFDAPAFLMEDESGEYDSPENVKFMESIGSEVYSFKTAPNKIVLK